MQDKLEFEIVTPDHRVLQEAVDSVILPSVEGYFGVLPGHAPLLAILDAGEVSFEAGGKRRFVAVSGGYVEVLRNRVSVLAETSELAEEIDPDRAERAKTRALEELKKKDLAPDRMARAELRLKRALSRISVRGRLG